AYLVYKPDDSDSDSALLGHAFVNALAIVCFFIVATFVIVICYKFKFTNLKALQGLGSTLFLLSVYKKALPALPISILLGVAIYLWVRFVLVDFMDSTVVMQ
ncbi:hypothetical protein DYB32_000380, partial [Aphanomyces invadans]